MPVYVYKCKACLGKSNVFKKLAELNRQETCRYCESMIPMERQVCAPMVIGDYPGYACPITGKWIEGRKAHEENLKKHDCRVCEPGETEALQRRRAYDEKVLDESIGQTIDQWIAEAPVEKREALAQAESMGISAEVQTATVNTPAPIATAIAA